MPSIRQSIRSSTASKRPTSAIADGQIALNTASGTPGIFFKDSAGNIVKAGPAHYGATAPNSSPAVGGSTGNSIGEAWLDVSLTPAGWKIWNGSAWVNATPLSSDTVQGLVELATNAETQAGVDAARVVTAASLQSKVSDSISTTSASGIASSTAVKTAYDLANAALPKSGGIVTGNLEIGSTGSFTFEGATADGFETTLAVVDPTADRTITFPNITGTVVTTGDTGTVTGTMIADSTIANAKISPTAAIAFSKLATLSSANILVGNASGVPTSTTVSGDVTITNVGVTAIASNVIVNADINSAAAIAYSKLALSSGITNTDVSASAAIVYSKLALSNSIVNADIGTSAAIAGTKISPNFGSQNIQTSGTTIAGLGIFGLGSAAAPSIAFSGDTNNGIYSPGADQVAISTNGTSRIVVDASGNVNIDSNTFYVDAANNRAGISTTAPNRKLEVSDASADNFIRVNTTGVSKSGIEFANGGTVYSQLYFNNTSPYDFSLLQQYTTGSLILGTNNTERARIDSSGRLLVGTTSHATVGDTQYTYLQIQGGPGGSLWGGIGLTRNEAPTSIAVDEAIGQIYFGANNGSPFASISCFADGTAGTGDYPGRLVFSTTSDGAATPTERLRITSAGLVGIGTTPAAGSLLHVNSAASTDCKQQLSVTTSTQAAFTAYVNTTVSTVGTENSTGGSLMSGSAPYATVISNGGAYPINFGTNNSIKATIDSSGRLLVGTSSGLTGSVSQYAKLAVVGNTSNGANGAYFAIGRGTAGTSFVSGTDIGQIFWTDNAGAEFASIAGAADGTCGSGDFPGRLVFSTTADGASSPTERIRLENTGRPLFFSSGNGIAVRVAAGAGTSTELFAGIYSGTSTTVGGTASIIIYSNGNVLNTNNSYGALSDIKLKENIVDAGSQWADLKALQVRKYNFKEGQTHTQIGLVAQEVELVSPGLVSESPDRDSDGNDLGTVTKSVNYSVLYMKAVKALQEAMDRIEALEASNADLLARVTALEAA